MELQGLDQRPIIGDKDEITEWELRRCCTSRSLLEPCCVDRLTSLPDELIGQILSMLPTTKDVAATQVLCKRMRTHAFNWITCVNLDESPISLCVDQPHLIDHFPLFELFVDNLLQKLSESGQPLTRFRLHFVGNSEGRENHHTCDGECFPILKPDRLNTWISHPLTYLGLKELDLSFPVRNPSDFQLPPGFFACQSLEVLKLDSNIELDGSKTPYVCLPNLKLLYLDSFFIVENDFIARLVSSCPSLEDLTVAFCLLKQLDGLAISAHSLKRMVLIIRISNYNEEYDNELVLIDTPNLDYFHYDSKLTKQYLITNMNVLSHAHLDFDFSSYLDSYEDFRLIHLSLLRMMSDVQHLSLLGASVEIMHYGGGFKDQPPVFPNLKTLELGRIELEARWDIVLPEILTSSPSLETLAFPVGFFFDAEDTEVDPEVADLEDTILETTEATPQCLQSSLKRIVINFGVTRDINIIKFLLRKASVLQELVICLSPTRTDVQRYDSMVLENVLKTLPRASITCSILLPK